MSKIKLIKARFYIIKNDILLFITRRLLDVVDSLQEAINYTQKIIVDLLDGIDDIDI